MTRQQRAATVVVAFLWMWMTVAAAQEHAPSFRVEQAEIDIGTVIAGTTVTADFIFHNDGPDDVHIIRAKPS